MKFFYLIMSFTEIFGHFIFLIYLLEPFNEYETIFFLKDLIFLHSNFIYNLKISNSIKKSILLTKQSNQNLNCKKRNGGKERSNHALLFTTHKRFIGPTR